MPFFTSLGALLGGATEEAGKIHQERYQQEQSDRQFAFNTLTHIMDDPAIGNPQVKEEALQELHGRMLQTMFPDNYSHKPGKLGKLVDQFVGMQRPQGPMGPMSTSGAGGPQQFGVGTGNAKGQVGMLPPPPQGMDQSQVAGSGGMLQGLQPPQQVFGPQDITASGFMSPTASMQVAAEKQAQLDQVKFQRDYATKLATWKWLEQNDPLIAKMSPEEKNLEHARFMYNMVTPVSYLRNEQASGTNISFEEAQQMAQQFGLQLPQGADANKRFTYYHDLTGKPTSLQFATPLAPIQTGTQADPNSPTGFSRGFSSRDNPGQISGNYSVPPPYGQQPRTSISQHVETLADGTVIKFPLTSVSGPSAQIQQMWKQQPSSIGFDPTQAASKDNLPPGAEVVGSKNVPDFIPKLDGQRQAMLNTMELVENFRSKISKIDSLIDTGKLYLGLDPNSPAGFAANQLLPWSKDEADTVAEMLSLGEHINTLRGPLGATGFRGAEAFAALQAQRGNLLANPAISTALLDNTQKALAGQIASENKSLLPAGRSFPEYYKPIIMQMYKRVYGPAARQKLIDDGYYKEQ